MKTEGYAKKMVVLLVAVAALTACNTMQGVGKDVKKAGESLENAAKR